MNHVRFFVTVGLPPIRGGINRYNLTRVTVLVTFLPRKVTVLPLFVAVSVTVLKLAKIAVTVSVTVLPVFSFFRWSIFEARRMIFLGGQIAT